MSRNINDLREAMFDTLAELRAGKITVEQAKAVSDIGQTIINSAKVEADYTRINSPILTLRKRKSWRSGASSVTSQSPPLFLLFSRLGKPRVAGA